MGKSGTQCNDRNFSDFWQNNYSNLRKRDKCFSLLTGHHKAVSATQNKDWFIFRVNFIIASVKKMAAKFLLLVAVSVCLAASVAGKVLRRAADFNRNVERKRSEVKQCCLPPELTLSATFVASQRNSWNSYDAYDDKVSTSLFHFSEF